jgi:small multidrug resistance family-3 protein
LVWQWLRDGKGLIWGLAGSVVLVIYGIIPTLQAKPAFGRVYSAYGGIFIVLSIFWARVVDGWHPDPFDILGTGLALFGVFIMVWGRNWF